MTKETQAADLSDRIRESLARIGRGQPTPEDVANITSLINQRIELSVERGLRVAQMRADHAFKPRRKL
jgi:hypothetical protein